MEKMIFAFFVLLTGVGSSAGAVPQKSSDKITYLVDEDFRDVKGVLPENWVNRSNKSSPSVVTRDLGAIHPTPGKDRVFHSFDVPAAIDGDFFVEVKFSSFRQAPVTKGKPQFPNLGLLLLDSKGKPASKDGALQVWQEANETFANQGGYLTLQANGDEKSTSTKPVRANGEGFPHTLRIERKGKDYAVSADGDVVYTGTLGDLGSQPLAGC